MRNKGLLHFVDQDLADIFRPLQWLLTPLGTTQFFFSGNRPQPPRFYKLYTGLVLASACAFYCSVFHEKLLINKYEQILMISVYFALYFATMVRVLLCKKDKIIKLILLMQEIDKRLALPRSAIYFARLRKYNIFWFVALCSVHLGMYTFNNWTTKTGFVSLEVMLLIMKIVIDVELVCFINVVSIISSRLRYFNSILEAKSDFEVSGERSESGARVDLLMCYRKIVYAIKIVNDFYGTELVIIFLGEFYLTTRCVMAMMYVLKSIDKFEMQLKLLMHTIFLFRHVAVFLMPSVKGQELANLLEATEVCCGIIVQFNADAEERRACAGVLALHGALTPALRMAEARAAAVDGRWPPRALASFAACVVVLLQLDVVASAPA